MTQPSYGAYPVRSGAGTVAGYVHHDDTPQGHRYRAVPRTAPGQWGARTVRYPTHTAAASAVLAHHYTHTATS